MVKTRRGGIAMGLVALLLVIVGLSMAITGGATAQAADIVVAADGNAEYTSIQHAVDNASDTASIEIESGTYAEAVVVDKNVTIDAPSGATITNGSAVVSRDGVRITGNASPTVSGLTLTGWGNAINGYESTGDWIVVDTTLANVGGGIDASYSTGDWQLTNTTIRSASEYGIVAVGTAGGQVVSESVIRESGHGISFSESTGDWRIDGTTIENTDSEGIVASDSAGDWEITETTISDTGDNAIVPYKSIGNWTITATTIRNSDADGIDAGRVDTGHIQNVSVTNVTDNGIITAEADGDWVVEDTTVRGAGETGILTSGSEGSGTIRQVTVTNTTSGVDFYNSSGDWVVQNVTVQDAKVGIYANRTAGDWLVTESSLTDIGIVAVQAGKTEGQWQISESIITNGNTNATGAREADIKGNASYNYWGASDGPGGTLNGSGGAVRGNLKVTPFYTDASLTTVSSKIGNDSDSGSQNGSTGFVDVAASDLAGSGTAADPYIITNASELQAMEDDPAAHYELGNDIDASGTGNWNNGSGYRPAGPFAGSLDGADHVVTGLYINRSSDNFVGLISSVDGSGSVSDIGIEQADISGAFATGPLVGSVDAKGTVTDSYATGTVSGSTVGGLVGVVDDTGTVNSSHASTTITDSDRAGGLVGRTERNATISNSYATGTVNGSSSVGGLLGNHDDNATVTNSYATGDVLADSNMGGFVGLIQESPTIRRSYATGSVTGSSESRDVGGFAGTASFANGNIRIIDSYATGNVSGSKNVGGFIGKQSGDTIAITESYAAGNVSGSNRVGGFVGLQNSGSVIDSYWDIDASDLTESAGNATGLSTAQMTGAAAETNMGGFAFGTVWETQPNDYPTLIGIDIPTTTQVQLSNVELRPATVGSPANHNLTFTMSDISADNQTDTISVTLPNSVTVVNVSNVRSTDTDYDVTVTNQKSPIELAVNPDEAVDTVKFDVSIMMRLKADGS